MPLYYNMARIKWTTTGGETKAKYRVMVYKSKEFLKVCDKMSKKGCKVKYSDPSTLASVDGEIAEDGIYYLGGCPMIHVESSEAGLTSDLDCFAVWWRPVEE